MLVGRRPERRRIDALLASARLGRSGVLVLTGEPGIGKTALLQYAEEAAVGMRQLKVTGIESERDLPFAGLAQLLRITAADLDHLPSPQAQALGVALALRTGSGADRFAVGAGLLSLLSRRSLDQPICLLVDDAHLLDTPSQDALAFVARRVLADAIGMIAAARTSEPCRLVAPDLAALPLFGVDADATAEIVRSERADWTRGMSSRIHHLTGGNPLAIRDLVDSYDQLAGLPPDAPVPVSTRLSDRYAQRAAGLAPATTTAVVVAAAAGEDLSTVVKAIGVLGVEAEGIGKALADAEDAGLLTVEADRVRFTHPLARSGLYASASPARRREVHAAIAEVLPGADADRRAWHRSAAAVGPAEQIAVEMQAVAARAADRGAYAVAAAAAERAAVLSATNRSRAPRWLAAGTWAWHAGEAMRARELLARAADADPSPSTAATVGRIRGMIAARCGAVDEARDVLIAAGDASVDPNEQIACFAEAISACLYLADAGTALAVADRISAVLADADPRAAVLGMTAAGMGRILGGLDGAPLIRAAAVQSSTVEPYSADGLDDASWRSIATLFLRDSGVGRTLIEQVVAERRASAAIGALPHLLFNIARDEATTDRWSHAEADYTEAIGLAREFGQTTELAASLAGLAWLEARQGRAEAATAHAQEAADFSERFHLHLGRIWAQLALADLAAGAGDAGSAARQYEDVGTLLSALGVLDVDLAPIPELIEVRLSLTPAAADRAGLQALADDYARRAEAKGQPWALARAARIRALLSDDADLDAAFGTALDWHAATPDAYEEARTRLAYGSRLRRARRRVDARPELRRSLEIFAALGAVPWTRRAADELAATGITVARPGESPASQLTPRELQIARLLVEHLTTRQVAAALFLSPKTVEYHLRHIYTKFGIDSRAELVDRLGGTASASAASMLS